MGGMGHTGVYGYVYTHYDRDEEIQVVNHNSNYPRFAI